MVDVPARAPRGRRTSSADLVRGRRIRVRRGQMLVPAGPTPEPTRDVPAPLPPMQPIDVQRVEEPNTAAERQRWRLEFPHGGSDDEQRRAVDQFVVDLQVAVSDTYRKFRNRRYFETQGPTRQEIESCLRDLGYRPSVIEDYRDAVREREGQLRVRRLLMGARRWRYWALALRAGLDMFL